MLIFSSKQHCQFWARCCEASAGLQGHNYLQSTWPQTFLIPSLLTVLLWNPPLHPLVELSYQVDLNTLPVPTIKTSDFIPHQPYHSSQLSSHLSSFCIFKLSFIWFLFTIIGVYLISTSEDNTFRQQILIQLSFFFFPFPAKIQVLYQIFDLQMYSPNQHFVFLCPKQYLSKSRSS